LVLEGGSEVLSRAPLIYNVNAVRWFGKMMKAKSAMQKIKLFSQLPLRAFLTPTITLLKGLTDPLYKIGMGQTAEIVATRFGITRQEMDEFSCQSHLKAAKAFDAGYLQQEIASIVDAKGNIDEIDTGLRRDSSVEQLGKLKPMFDKVYGRVTAGNSSQVTDGACVLMLASEEALKKYHLTPLAQIKDIQWAGCEPTQMGLGPVHATTPILQRHQLSLSDIDYWEMNEAFAGQVLGCLAAWKSDDYCRTELGLDQALGSLDLSHLNVDGGAVALGHPVGASGARIVLHLANVLKRQNAKRGIATICIGGGQGGAMLLESC
jgi:acetyl-CoA C-acetyltransferase